MFECLPARSAAPVPPPSLFIDKTARSRFAPRESEAAAHGTPPNCYTYTTVGGREGRREKCRRDRGRELGRGGADGTRAVDGRRAWWLRAKSPIRRKEIVVGGGSSSRGRRTPAGEGTVHAKRQNLDGMGRQDCLWVALSHQVSPLEGGILRTRA